MAMNTERHLLSEGMSTRDAMQSMVAAQVESWDNEGGSLASAIPSFRRRLDRPVLRRRRPEDTAVGCREHAAADLARASLGGKGRGAWLYESSAASWSKRAEMLDRLVTRRDF
jgi:hypothetical protein